MPDRLSESPIYQMIWREGYELGRYQRETLKELSESSLYQIILREGAEKSLREELERLKRLLEGVISKRFPKLLRLAKQCTVDVNDPELLPNLVLNLITADEAEAEQCLRSFDESVILRKEEVMNMLRKVGESPAYQGTSLAERLDAAHKLLPEIVSKLFPKLLPLAQHCLVTASDPDALLNLMVMLILSDDKTRAERYLSAFHENGGQALDFSRVV